MVADTFTEQARVLVTGAEGQIGQELTGLLAREPGFTLVARSKGSLDITHRAELERELAEELPDVVVNCAGFNRVDPAESDPGQAYAVNSEAVRGLAEVCAELGIILIHLSSDYVFDGHYASGYSESEVQLWLLNFLPRCCRDYFSKGVMEDYVTKEAMTIQTKWLTLAVMAPAVTT